MTPLDSVAAILADRVLAGSIQAIVLVGIVWLGCRSVRLSYSMQALLWWAVALKLVLVFAPLPAIEVPILPAPAIAGAPGTASAGIVTRSTSVVRGGSAPLRPAAVTADGVIRAGILTAVGMWLIGLAWHVVRMGRAWRRARAVVRRSMHSPEDEPLVSTLAAAVGLGTTPAVHVSGEVTTPQVVGVWRPVVLMPADAALSDHERAMAISHELVHVRRRDLLLGWIPAAAERLFFFHPLVRMATREYLTAREAACDAAVVESLRVEPSEYGALLVRFGVTSQVPASAAGVGSESASVLRRRLDMLRHCSGRGSSRIAWVVVTAALLVIAPMRLVAVNESAPLPGVQTPVPGTAPAEQAGTPAAASPTRPSSANAASPAPLPTPEDRAWRDDQSRLADDYRRQADDYRRQMKDFERMMQNTDWTAILSMEAKSLQDLVQSFDESFAKDAEQRLEQELRAAQADSSVEHSYAELLKQPLAALEAALRAQTDQRLADVERDKAALADLLLQKAEEQKQRAAAASPDEVRERLQDLQRRLDLLAEMQRDLQKQTEELRRQLNGF